MTVEFVPNQIQLALMRLLHGYFSRIGKQWTIIDQAWMLEKMKMWHGVEIDRSTLARNLAGLRAAGMIETKRQRVARPSLYLHTKGLKRYFEQATDASAIRPGCGGDQPHPAGPMVDGRLSR